MQHLYETIEKGDFMNVRKAKQLDKEFIQNRFMYKMCSSYTLPLEPHYYRDEQGNHRIISGIMVSFFGESIVTFQYKGTLKLKGHRRSYPCSDMFKEVILSNNPKEIVKAYDSWHQTTKEHIKTLTQII